MELSKETSQAMPKSTHRISRSPLVLPLRKETNLLRYTLKRWLMYFSLARSQLRPYSYYPQHNSRQSSTASQQMVLAVANLILSSRVLPSKSRRLYLCKTQTIIASIPQMIFQPSYKQGNEMLGYFYWSFGRFSFYHLSLVMNVYLISLYGMRMCSRISLTTYNCPRIDQSTKVICYSRGMSCFFANLCSFSYYESSYCFLLRLYSSSAFCLSSYFLLEPLAQEKRLSYGYFEPPLRSGPPMPYGPCMWLPKPPIPPILPIPPIPMPPILPKPPSKPPPNPPSPPPKPPPIPPIPIPPMPPPKPPPPIPVPKSPAKSPIPMFFSPKGCPPCPFLYCSGSSLSSKSSKSSSESFFYLLIKDYMQSTQIIKSLGRKTNNEGFELRYV